MATARQRHDRMLVVVQAQLVGCLFGESRIDLDTYVQRGELAGSYKAPMPSMPEVDAKVAEINANGGKLIVEG